MQALIPAAGYGTRLYPLTKNNPKALIELAKGKPMLYFVLKKLEELNTDFPKTITKAVIISNAVFFEQIEGWIKENEKEFSFKLIVLNDGTKSNEERLGTLGDIQFAINKQKIDDDILIINSDNIFDFSLKPLMEKFKKTRKAVIGLYKVASLNLAKHYGIVEINKKGILKGFEEKPRKPKSRLASIGVYLYPRKTARKIKEFIKEKGVKNADKSGNFLEWLFSREKVFTVTFKGKWFDIGSLEQLEKARKYFKGK